MIYITCNMGAHDLPDMYALGPRASGIHIRQIPCAHVTTITYVYIYEISNPERKSLDRKILVAIYQIYQSYLPPNFVS